MATLYSLHFGRHPKGFGKPCVKAVRAKLAGNLCPETGEIVRPDTQAVREALPHYYRAAFDRAIGFWFRSVPGGDCFKPAYVTLRNSRGKYLNTLYAIPYSFTP